MREKLEYYGKKLEFTVLLQRTDIRRSVPCTLMREVENFVKCYLSTGLTNREILNVLVHQLHINIRIRTDETLFYS